MKITPYDRSRDLIIIDAEVWGPRASELVSLALDTGPSETALAPDIVDRLGYSPRHGELIVDHQDGEPLTPLIYNAGPGPRP